MKTQMLIAISLGLISLGYLGMSYYKESRLYYLSVEDCDRHKNINPKQFTRCWREKRNATYTLRKHYGHLP